MTKSLDDAIHEIMGKHQITGLAASVVWKGEIKWIGGYGFSNTEKQIPVTPHTRFRIASISKTVVGAAFMQLVERGLCGLDEDISDILDFPVRNPRHPYAAITPKHLMTHTSGLQDVYVDFVLASRSENPPKLRLSDILCPGGAYYTNSLWGSLPPGHQDSFHYSNLGAVLLATMIEKLSGERFDRYTQKHELEPLGMYESSFNLEHISDLNEVAVLYEYHAEDNRFIPAADDFGGIRPDPIDYSAYVPGTNGALFSPQGGLRTSSYDLARYMLTYLNEGQLDGARILRPETVALMHAPHWSGYAEDGFFRQSGLQFHITDSLIPGVQLVGHTGDAYGLLSAFFMDKSRGWGFAMMVNGLVQKKGLSAFWEVQEDIAHLFYENIQL